MNVVRPYCENQSENLAPMLLVFLFKKHYCVRLYLERPIISTLQYSPMSYQALEEVVARPKLTISNLQRFRKEHLQHFCEVNSINAQRKGDKEPTKATYITALLNAVCHYHDPRTHIDGLPETRCREEGSS